jgi:hypothetical protein
MPAPRRYGRTPSAEHHLRAGIAQRQRHRQAETAVSARDKRDLPFERERAAGHGHNQKNAMVLISMLSRIGASEGVSGSSNAL